MLDLSPDTQAILLLTAPLLNGRGTPAADLFKPAEYRELARSLRERDKRPADLLGPDADAVLADGVGVDAARVRVLLGRGLQLGDAVERWQARAIWVVSRADADYPARLRRRLREHAPAILYGCGDATALNRGGLAVVGSRDADLATLGYTEAVGALAAAAGRPIVSGGARGIDQAAMRGALEAGGRACGVLADSLERTAMTREHRDLLIDERLTLVSPYDPGAGFNTGHAMARNKLIYALADAALVIASDVNKGGTWAGAVEQLERFGQTPIYTRTGTSLSLGLEELQRRGARSWPEPSDPEGMVTVLDPATAEDSCEPPPAPPTGAILPFVPEAADPAEAIMTAVREQILRLLRTPKSEDEVAEALAIEKLQARTWLKRFVKDGEVRRQTKPVRFQTAGDRLL